MRAIGVLPSGLTGGWPIVVGADGRKVRLVRWIRGRSRRAPGRSPAAGRGRVAVARPRRAREVGRQPGGADRGTDGPTGRARRRSGRPPRPLVGRWRPDGADPRTPRHGVSDRCARRTALHGGRRPHHRARRVRHEGRHRPGDARRGRTRRRLRGRDAVHRRRGGRLGFVARRCWSNGRRPAATCWCSSRAPTAGRSRPVARAPARSRWSFAVGPRTPASNRKRASTR